MNNIHKEKWFRSGKVLLDIGEVGLQEFPGKCIRIYLPPKFLDTIEGLDSGMGRATEEAIRVAAWLRRKYGYRLSLPEMSEDAEIGIPAPEIGSRLSGAFQFKSPDGSIVKFDSSLQSGELDFIVRAASEGPDVRKALFWANAPTILSGILDRLNTLKAVQDSLPELILKALDEAIDKAVARALEYEPRAPLKAQEENRGYL